MDNLFPHILVCLIVLLSLGIVLFLMYLIYRKMLRIERELRETHAKATQAMFMAAQAKDASMMASTTCEDIQAQLQILHAEKQA